MAHGRTDNIEMETKITNTKNVQQAINRILTSNHHRGNDDYQYSA